MAGAATLMETWKLCVNFDLVIGTLFSQMNIQKVTWFLPDHRTPNHMSIRLLVDQFKLSSTMELGKEKWSLVTNLTS